MFSQEAGISYSMDEFDSEIGVKTCNGTHPSCMFVLSTQDEDTDGRLKRHCTYAQEL